MQSHRIEPLQTYLIIGLGNPGREHIMNRHNIGFMTVSKLADHFGITFLKMQSKALIAKTKHNNQTLILAKPQTYMNLSGKSVSGLIHYYKICVENLLIVYDDIDLPFGRIRLRQEGGAGGHKGVQSIIDCLGTNVFPRLRIGIGRPPGSKQAAGYVLRVFTKSELDEIPLILVHGVDAILAFIDEGITLTMNRFNALEKS